MRYVFDIDGTICFNGVSIDPLILEALKDLEKKGHELIFASARPIRDLLPVVGQFKKNALIGGNGSIIAKENIQVTRPIPEKSYQKILQLIQKYQLEYIVDDDWNYSANVTQTNAIFRQLDPDKLAENIPLEQVQRPIKIILLNLESYEQVYGELKKIAQLSLIIHREEGNIDITANGINKYSTLREYFEPAEYIAFGNDWNDLELLTYAKQGYFIGNQELLDQWGLSLAQTIKKEPKLIANFLESLA